MKAETRTLLLDTQVVLQQAYTTLNRLRVNDINGLSGDHPRSWGDHEPDGQVLMAVHTAIETIGAKLTFADPVLTIGSWVQVVHCDPRPGYIGHRGKILHQGGNHPTIVQWAVQFPTGEICYFLNRDLTLVPGSPA